MSNINTQASGNFLWPPLEEIERSLATSATTSALPSSEKRIVDRGPQSDLSTPTPEISSFVRDRIRQKVAARGIPQALPLQAGNILSIPLPDCSSDADLAQVGLVLDRQPDDAASAIDWEGWLAVREADYAGPWDVLLQTEDEPHDLSVAMIQTWNRVRLLVPQNARVLTRLTASRLQALRAVAEEARQGKHANAGSPIPGRIGLRHTDDGFQVLTGRPYRATDDPRLRYRTLYHSLAHRLEAATAAQLAQSSAQQAAKSPRDSGASVRSLLSFLLDQLSPTWMAPALGVAVVALVVQGVMIQSFEHEYAETRSQSPATQRLPEVQVTFVASTTEAEMRTLINQIRGELTGGPGTLGVYRIALPEGNVTEAIKILRASAKVESVDAVK